MAGGGGEGVVFFPGGARLRAVRVLLDGGAPGDARLPWSSPGGEMSPGNELACMSLRVAGEKKGKITGKKFGKWITFALSLHPLSRGRARGEGGSTRGSGKKV